MTKINCNVILFHQRKIFLLNCPEFLEMNTKSLISLIIIQKMAKVTIESNNEIVKKNLFAIFPKIFHY